jgi:hypothetical protein
MKLTLSKRVIAIILAVLLIISAFNTYLILSQNRALEAASMNGSGYEFIVTQDGASFKLKNTLTNQIEYGFIQGQFDLSRPRQLHLNRGHCGFQQVER